MSVKIRLSRFGRKKVPCYRIVVLDSRKRRDGAYIEQLGVYHPNERPVRLEVKDDRALYWLSVGARPSDTVRSLLSSKGIMVKHDLTKRGADPEKIEAEAQKVRELAESRENRKMHEADAKRKAKSAAKAAPKEEEAAEAIEAAADSEAANEDQKETSE